MGPDDNFITGGIARVDRLPETRVVPCGLSAMAAPKFRALVQRQANHYDGMSSLGGHEELFAWADTYDDAVENGMALLSLCSVFDGFTVEKAYRRVVD